MVHYASDQNVLEAFLHGVADEFAAVHRSHHFLAFVYGLDDILEGSVIAFLDMESVCLGGIAEILDIGAILRQPAIIQSEVLEL